MSSKPVVIICLDEGMANEVVAALPPERYDILVANVPNGRRFKEADAHVALDLFEKNKSKPGFIIADENSAGGMSGITPLVRAAKAGWHTVLRTGSLKDGMAPLADFYLSGEAAGDVPNAEAIARFVARRTDEAGQVMLKDKTRQLLKWETALAEFHTSHRDVAHAMIEALVEDMDRGKRSRLKEQMRNDAATRTVMRGAVKNIVDFLENPEARVSHLSHSDLRQLHEAATLSPEEGFYRDDPHGYHNAAYREILGRERAGDEPAGSAADYLMRAKERTPGYDLIGEHDELDPAKFARVRALIDDPQKLNAGFELMEQHHGTTGTDETAAVASIGGALGWENRKADERRKWAGTVKPGEKKGAPPADAPPADAGEDKAIPLQGSASAGPVISSYVDTREEMRHPRIHLEKGERRELTDRLSRRLPGGASDEPPSFGRR